MLPCKLDFCMFKKELWPYYVLFLFLNFGPGDVKRLSYEDLVEAPIKLMTHQFNKTFLIYLIKD